MLWQRVYYIPNLIVLSIKLLLPEHRGREVLSGPFRCVQAGRFVVVGPSW